jgi:hypothetical protein
MMAKPGQDDLSDHDERRMRAACFAIFGRLVAVGILGLASWAMGVKPFP